MLRHRWRRTRALPTDIASPITNGKASVFEETKKSNAAHSPLSARRLTVEIGRIFGSVDPTDEFRICRLSNRRQPSRISNARYSRGGSEGGFDKKVGVVLEWIEAAS